MRISSEPTMTSRKIEVTVKPGASRNAVEDLGAAKYKIWVTARPDQGKANQAVIKLLADFFKVPKSRIQILRGETVRTKLIELLLP